MANINLLHVGLQCTRIHLLLAGNDTVSILVSRGGGMRSTECPLVVVVVVTHAEGRRGVVFVGFCLSVYLHDISKTDAAKITEPGIQIFHDESWKLIFLGSKGRGSRSRVVVSYSCRRVFSAYAVMGWAARDWWCRRRWRAWWAELSVASRTTCLPASRWLWSVQRAPFSSSKPSSTISASKQTN